MKRINWRTINKDKFDFSLIIFGLLLCIPFSVFLNIVDKYLNLIILLLISFYLLIGVGSCSKKSFRTFMITIFIILSFSLYYIIGGYAYLNSLYIQIVYTIFTLSIYIYIKSKNHIEIATKYFLTIINYVSIVTIIAFIVSNTKIISFRVIELGGYQVGYNFILGGISSGRLFDRPQYYFSEPSYLGFFLGFCVLFMNNYTTSKIKKRKIFTVLIAGILVFSFTFYFAIIAGIISEIVSYVLKKFYKTKTISLIFFISFIIISTIYITQINKFGNISVDETVQSFSQRNERMNTSLYTISEMDFREILLGKGTGYITFLDTSRDLGESNAYIRAFVENGVIILAIYLFIILYYLKNSPSLLLYSLVALHSVVVLETPMFFLIILIASTINQEKNNQNEIELQNL